MTFYYLYKIIVPIQKITVQPIVRNLEFCRSWETYSQLFKIFRLIFKG